MRPSMPGECGEHEPDARVLRAGELRRASSGSVDPRRPADDRAAGRAPGRRAPRDRGGGDVVAAPDAARVTSARRACRLSSIASSSDEPSRTYRNGAGRREHDGHREREGERQPDPDRDPAHPALAAVPRQPVAGAAHRLDRAAAERPVDLLA